MCSLRSCWRRKAATLALIESDVVDADDGGGPWSEMAGTARCVDGGGGRSGTVRCCGGTIDGTLADEWEKEDDFSGPGGNGGFGFTVVALSEE